jgi:hypothetical protein
VTESFCSLPYASSSNLVHYLALFSVTFPKGKEYTHTKHTHTHTHSLSLSLSESLSHLLKGGVGFFHVSKLCLQLLDLERGGERDEGESGRERERGREEKGDEH